MRVLLERKIYVHSPNRSNDRRYGEQDSHRRKELHDPVQIVRDHGSKRVHHRGEGVGINLGHLGGLFVLHDDILEKFPPGKLPEAKYMTQRDKEEIDALLKGVDKGGKHIYTVCYPS